MIAALPRRRRIALRMRPWFERLSDSQRRIVAGLRRGDSVDTIAQLLEVRPESVRKSIWRMACRLPGDLPATSRVTVWARHGLEALTVPVEA